MEIGHFQTLKIIDMKPFGAILEGRILLPKKEVPEDAKIGDRLKVFLLKDNKGRPIASLKKPAAQLGDLAVLQVKAISKPGAFLDWGMDKDLLLPYKEQTRRLREGDWVLVYIYLDKTKRLAASMKVKGKFAFPKNLKEDDRVEGKVYSIHPKLGAFTLVEGAYNGLLPKEKTQTPVRLGQDLTLRVENIKPDGKIDLSMLARTYQRLDEDGHTIYSTLKANGGFLRLNDYSKPEKVRMVLGMSKGQFKRALGGLLKEGTVRFKDDGIQLVDKGKGRKS